MESTKHPSSHDVAVREITIDKTKYNVKSVFTGQTNLEDALINIIRRKMEENRAA